MDNVLIYIFSILGALGNRISGGFLELPLKKLAFPLFTIFMTFTITTSYVLSLVLGIMMYVGRAPGWGRYIGTLGGWETNPLVEVRKIDQVLRFLFSLVDTVPDQSKLTKRIWGFLGLTFRGLFWSTLLSIPFTLMAIFYEDNRYVPLVTYIGPLMGVIYSIGLSICYIIFSKDENIELWRGKGWVLSEALFGALLLGTLTYDCIYVYDNYLNNLFIYSV